MGRGGGCRGKAHPGVAEQRSEAVWAGSGAAEVAFALPALPLLKPRITALMALSLALLEIERGVVAGLTVQLSCRAITLRSTPGCPSVCVLQLGFSISLFCFYCSCKFTCRIPSSRKNQCRESERLEVTVR